MCTKVILLYASLLLSVNILAQVKTTNIQKEIITVPTSFTPNKDGKNDTWFGVINHEIDSLNIKVFNRWGQEVFFSNNKFFEWDGNDKKGNLVSDGIYTFLATIFISKDKKLQKGSFFVITKP